MKRINKFAIVCTGIIGVGILLTGVGYAMGGRVLGMGLGSGGIQVVSPNIIDESGSAIHYIEKTEELASFDSMDISMDYGDIWIVPSDHYGIEYCVDERYGFAPEVTDGCLVAKEKPISYVSSGYVLWGAGNNGFMVNGNIETKNQYIKIYVPADTQFKSIVVYNDLGDVTCEGIQTEKLDLDADFGNVTLSNITGNETTLQIGDGKLELSDYIGEELTIENDFGDVQLEAVESGERIDITMGSGDVEGKKLQTAELTVEQDFGEVLLEDSEITGKTNITSESGAVTLEQYVTDRLIIDSSFGDVEGDTVAATESTITLQSGKCEIVWTKINTLVIESDFGDVEVTLPEDTSTYKMDLETDFGKVCVDRKDMGENYHANTKGADSITLECSSGDIRVDGAKAAK